MKSLLTCTIIDGRGVTPLELHDAVLHYARHFSYAGHLFHDSFREGNRGPVSPSN